MSTDELAEKIGRMKDRFGERELFTEFVIESNKEERQKQLEEGKYLLASEDVHVDEAAAGEVFAELLEVLHEGLEEGRGEWEKLQWALGSDDTIPVKMVTMTMTHDWGGMQALGRELEIDLDVLQFFSLYLARPFRKQAGRILGEDLDLEVWRQGYCPVCGHSPMLGSLAGSGGPRDLWCFCCDTRWHFVRIGCPYCGNREQEELGYFRIEGYPGHRIYFCEPCKRYLKVLTIEQEGEAARIHYDREYLTTAELDEAALQQGFISEPVWLVKKL